jgi:hypothetical protein
MPLDAAVAVFGAHPCCEFDCEGSTRVTAPGKWHLVVTLDGVEVWADWREPIVAEINTLHAARAAMLPDPPRARARVAAWHEQHVEQSLACQERRCDH